MKKELSIITMIPLLFFLASCSAPTPTSVPTPSAAFAATSAPRPTLTHAPTPTLVASWPGLQDGWMTFQGVPVINDSTIAYDPQGYLWATTAHGLYRLNIKTGQAVRYTESDGLPASFYQTIYAADRMWVFSANGKTVAYFGGDTWTTETTDFGNVRQVFYAEDRLWVDGNLGLYYLDQQEWKLFNDIPAEYQGHIVRIARSKGNFLWFFIYTLDDAGRKYVLRFDGKTWKNYDNLILADKMLTTSDGILWFVFNNSLVSFDGQRFTPLVLPGNYYNYATYDLVLTSDGDIWLPVGKEDVFLIQNGRAVKQVFDGFDDIPDDAARGPVALIPEGWVFKGENDIYIYNKKDWKKYGLAVSDSPISQLIGNGSDVIGFTLDGALWAWRYDGLIRFDGKEMEEVPGGELYRSSGGGSISRFDSGGVLWSIDPGSQILSFGKPGQNEVTNLDLHYPISDFSFAPDGSVWIAFKDGFIANLLPEIARNKGYLYNAQDETTFVDLDKIKINGDQSPKTVFEPERIVVAPDGLIWVLAPKFGAYSYNGKAWMLHHETILVSHNGFAVGTKNQFWALANIVDMLVGFDGRKWNQYPYPFRNDDVNSDTHFDCFFPDHLTIARDNSVWFTAKCGDVFRFDGTTWTHFEKDKELAGIIPTNILLAPDGALWFFSDTGWARYKP